MTGVPVIPALELLLSSAVERYFNPLLEERARSHYIEESIFYLDSQR